ncbi:cysteine desulfurase [Aestuariispira insulae]|uniref:Cysteine desulfurase n=1 Tax=Aestuariispira insulae TaxID=1461337 RepID=A0A3D9HSA1_9PROT|nr:cysteine desulfurase [Aestuariispira insulae]RED52340.1 cysteine desulfurase/selenocysteine lyase [Aestuariispira insulae]
MSEQAMSAANDFYDLEAIRADFPILQEKVHGHPLCFLDNGASAQKPLAVINAMRSVYEECYANVHRGAYSFSEQTTFAYEQARRKIQAYLNARSEKEIIFTGNATGAINLVAHAFGRGLLKAGDEVIISEMEHHSNIVPWQMLRDEKGIVLKVAPISDDGAFRFDEFKALLSDKTKLVAVTHVSNVLGTVTPAKQIVEAAHDMGAKVLFDGSQAVMHMPIDVQDLDCDFYVFTGHKLYGPSGIGVLYGKEALLDAMPPFLGGGDMIASVTLEQSTWAELPAKFEAGTPPIVQAIGLGAAVDYVSSVGLERIARHEQGLLNYATQQLASVDGLRLVGTAPAKTSVVSFVIDGTHPHDVATIVDQKGVAIRAGHHCAEPLMHRMGVTGTSRASFGMYNSKEEVDVLVSSLQKVKEIFG